MVERTATLDEITDAVIGRAIRLHRELGPGLLEVVYMSLLSRALQRSGFQVQTQRYVSLEHDGLLLANAFRPDLVVNDRVIVEIKSTERVNPVHKKQLLTYLRIMRLPVGLLINFGEETLKQGLSRIVNNLKESESPLIRVNQVYEEDSPGSDTTTPQ